MIEALIVGIVAVLLVLLGWCLHLDEDSTTDRTMK